MAFINTKQARFVPEYLILKTLLYKIIQFLPGLLKRQGRDIIQFIPGP
jgi:hypothetical protein